QHAEYVGPFPPRGAIARAQRRHGAVLSEMLAKAVAQSARAVAVDEPQVRGSREKRLVERLLRRVDGLFEVLADEMHLGNRAGIVAAAGHGPGGSGRQKHRDT